MFVVEYLEGTEKPKEQKANTCIVIMEVNFFVVVVYLWIYSEYLLNASCVLGTGIHQ